jgi:hypothetical protein
MSAPSETPLMQQYREIKSRHRDAILLFRMGDFYEMFYDDAETGSRALGLTLTARNNGGAAAVPLAGVPAKALSEYVRRLIQQGFRVAICDQVEDPKTAKGVVRREVVETITPGAAFADELLESVRNNFLCAVVSGPETAGGAAKRMLGIAAADLSTGEFRIATVPWADAPAMLARLVHREVLVSRGGALPPGFRMDGVLLTERDAWEFDGTGGSDELTRQFGVASLEGFGIGADDAIATGAAGALLRYLRELQPAGVPHLGRPVVERPSGVMPIDDMTRRNLELVESLRGGDGEGTLIDVLDRTQTPMGARLLRQWTGSGPWWPMHLPGKCCAGRSMECATWSGWRSKRRRRARRRGSSGPSATRSRVCRRWPLPSRGSPLRTGIHSPGSRRTGMAATMSASRSAVCWWNARRPPSVTNRRSPWAPMRPSMRSVHSAMAGKTGSPRFRPPSGTGRASPRSRSDTIASSATTSK